MKTMSIREILNNPGLIINKQVIIYGWVRTKRDSKAGISFIDVYDGSCFATLQIIASLNLINYKEEILRLTTGCAVQIIGTIVKSIGHKQNCELHANMMKVLGWIDNPNSYPVSSKQHSMEHLREVAHLRPRTNIIGVISRIRHTLFHAIHHYMHKHGFFWVTTPIITSSDTEGLSKMFRVSTLNLENLPRNIDGMVNYKKDFFGQETFLTVSGQLNSESYACALSKVYTFGPTFRAEESNTSRHLAEFWMLEPEVAFANLKNIVDFSVSLLKYILKIVLNECIEDIEFLVKKIDKHIISRLESFLINDCICISYSEIVDILHSSGKFFADSIIWGEDFNSEHEKFLTEKYFKSPVIIMNYPKDIKAFYMRLNDDFRTVASMDLLVPKVGEIIGGSQREERLYVLDRRLKELGLNKENYYWYRDLRRYGTVPHSGFGLGFERLMLYVTGIQNIRDIIPFPRYPNSISF